MLSHDVVRSATRLVPGAATGARDALADWLARHRRLLTVVVSVGVGALLIGSDAFPRLLLPFVAGPVIAVILTALVARNGDAERSR